MRLQFVRGAVALCGLLAALVAPRAHAQGVTGIIQGTVLATGTRAPVTDARVQVVGTVLVAVTSSRGEYRVVNVPAGQQTLSISRIGYKAERIRVSVIAGQTTVHDQLMNESAANLTEVVVTGTAGNQERRAQAATVTSVDASKLVETGPI